MRYNKFMRDRYGYDELSLFIVRIYFIMLIVNIFIKWYVIDIISFILFIITIYRFLSRDKSKRYKENREFIRYRDKILSPFIKKLRYIRKKYKDREYYIYRKCRGCGKVLRLSIPYKRGIKYVKCPSCKKRNRYVILRKQKIDIIRKKGR